MCVWVFSLRSFTYMLGLGLYGEYVGEYWVFVLVGGGAKSGGSERRSGEEEEEGSEECACVGRLAAGKVDSRLGEKCANFEDLCLCRKIACGFISRLCDRVLGYGIILFRSLLFI